MKRKCIGLVISCGVLSLLLTNCRNASSISQNTQEDIALINNDFLGEWHSVKRYIPYGATLTIDSNFIFTFDGGACESRFGSYGHWTLNGDTLILNNIKPEICYHLKDFGVNCITVDPNNPEKPKIVTTKDGCTPKTDFTFIIFDNEKFIIRDGALTHIRKPGRLCPDIKDDFTKQKI